MAANTVHYSDLTINDIFDYNGKSMVVTKTSRYKGMVVIIADEVGSVRSWRIRQWPGTTVTVTGKKPIVQAKNMRNGDLMIWKGKRGEAMLFTYQYTSPDGTIVATNPIDGKTWSLSGSSTAYAQLEDILNKTVQL